MSLVLIRQVQIFIMVPMINWFFRGEELPEWFSSTALLPILSSGASNFIFPECTILCYLLQYINM